MAAKLSIFEDVKFNEVITKEEYHTYYPRTSNFNLNDEFRIPIQQQDIYTLPSASYIYIEGKINAVKDGSGKCVLTNNAYAFLVNQIRYELNGVEVDGCIKPGITATMKAYISYVGFAEDYTKVVINASQELILLRSKTDDNCYKNDTAGETKKATIEIEKIEWHVPHIWVNDETCLTLLETLRDNKPIYIPFRKWELYELPSLRTTTTDIWSVKTSTNMEKTSIRYCGFPKDKKDNFLADATAFNHCAITNIKLYLNSENYPYDKLNLNMSQKQYAIAYHMYSAFQESYYNRPNQPLLDYRKFGEHPLFVIDCSKQNESLKSATVDIKLEMECDKRYSRILSHFT